MSNQVVLAGLVIDLNFEENIINKKRYHKAVVSVKRESGTDDRIPVMIPADIISADMAGKYVGIKGRYRSRNVHEPEKTRLELMVYADSADILSKPCNVNDTFLEGFLTKSPVIRTSPKCRKIAEVMLAVKNEIGSDYIPCIFWEDTIDCLSGINVGDCIRVAGRLQSREYSGNRTAYELSVNLAEII